MATKHDKIPLILDTDIGSDIDDAVCLAYLLRQPRCELLGVTTVSGKPQERAALADAVCRAAGRTDVPVHAGQDQGFLLGTVQPECPQSSVLSCFEHRPPQDFRPNTAFDFLRHTIHERPGEITLLAVGPMTNLALLFAADPEIPKMLKHLVLMCGVFTNRTAGVGPLEWNAHCDPIATALVYKAPVPDFTSIGLEVTNKCKIESNECIQRFNKIGGPLTVVSAMTGVWSKQSKQVTFHDPLAAAVIFEPELCEYQSGQVDVELLSERVKGMTHFNFRAEPKPHRIAVEVNPEDFFEHYFRITAGLKCTPLSGQKDSIFKV